MKGRDLTGTAAPGVSPLMTFRSGLACSAAARALGPGPGSRGMSPPQPTSQPGWSERAEPAAAPQTPAARAPLRRVAPAVATAVP